MFSAFKALK